MGEEKGQETSRRDLEMWSLGRIEPSLGGLCDMELGAKPRFAVRPAPDLLLESTVIFVASLPKEYPSLAPRVRFENFEALPLQYVESDGQWRRSDELGEITVDAKTSSLSMSLLDEKLQCGWSRTYDLCVLFYAVRRMFTRLEKLWEWFPMPPVVDVNVVPPDQIRHCEKRSLLAGEHGLKGRRRDMEDVTSIKLQVKLKNNQAISLACIFDGHGGRNCAAWAGERVPLRIFDYCDRLTDFREALFRAFKDADEEWFEAVVVAQKKQQPSLVYPPGPSQRRRQHNSTGSLFSNNSGPDASGCTAIAALFDGRALYVANLGDCRCVMARHQLQEENKVDLKTTETKVTAYDLSFDARADRPDEVARVCAARGFVANRRVNGQLAVSRALGDVAYKEPRHLKGPVIAEPDVVKIVTTAEDDFLILACDGLWDVLTSQAAVDFVLKHLTKGDDLEAIAKKLAKHAVDDRKSTDNVSVCILRFVPSITDLNHQRHTTSLDLTVHKNHRNNQHFPGGRLRQPQALFATNGRRASGSLLTRTGPYGAAAVDAEIMKRGSTLLFDRRNNNKNHHQHLGLNGNATDLTTSTTNRKQKQPPPKQPSRSSGNDDELMEFLLDDSNFQ